MEELLKHVIDRSEEMVFYSRENARHDSYLDQLLPTINLVEEVYSLLSNIGNCLEKDSSNKTFWLGLSSVFQDIEFELLKFLEETYDKIQTYWKAIKEIFPGRPKFDVSKETL